MGAGKKRRRTFNHKSHNVHLFKTVFVRVDSVLFANGSLGMEEFQVLSVYLFALPISVWDLLALLFKKACKIDSNLSFRYCQSTILYGFI